MKARRSSKAASAKKSPATASAAQSRGAEAKLSRFIARFTPEIAALGGACVAHMREKLPAAVVLVYDNYNALAVGFCPSERASDAVFSIAFYPRRVNLCFLQAGCSELKDPGQLLQGSGKLNRFIPLDAPEMLDAPAVRRLMDQALKAAATPIPRKGDGYVVIKSVSEKQRPRRPA